MKKYIRFYLKLLKLNIAGMIAYRANFYNSLASSLGWSVVSICAIFLLTSQTASIFGWTRQELFLLIGIYNILNGFFLMLFARNFEKFSRLINLGQLDSALLRPVDSQFFVSLSLFNITGAARIIVGSLFTWYIASIIGIHFEIINFIVFLLLLMLSMVIFYSVWFIVLIPVIWFNNLTNLVDFLYVVNNLGRYPSEMLLSTHNVFLFTLIPLTLIASIPAKELISKLSFVDLTHFILIALGLFFFSRKFYNYALRSYTSASS